MGKKYFGTKENTLESSILSVWAEAAKKEELSTKQKKLDVDGDGEIEGSDLAKLRKKGAKKEGNAFGKALKAAKEKGDKTFVVSGKTYEVTEADDLDEWKTLNASRRVAGGDKRRTENNKGSKAVAKEGFAVPEDVPSLEIGTDRYRDHTLDVTPGQDDPEWAAARDFKVSTMKEALAKVWGLDEKSLDKESKKDYDEEDEKLKPVKGSKTMTGGKVAKVEIQPKIDG